MIALARTRERALPILGLAALCAALLVAPQQTEALVLGVALFAVLLAVLMAFPLRYPALLLVLLVLGVENPSENPATGLWETPLRALGVLLFENLNTSVGFEALHLPLLDVLVLALLTLAVLRDDRGAPVPRPMNLLLYLALGGLALGELWGAAHGGDMRQSLYQIHALGFVPLLALLFLRAFRGPRDLAALGAALVVAALWKAGCGIYFLKFVCNPLEERPSYATTHSDSVLFEVALVVVMAYAVLKRSPAALGGGVLSALLICAGIYANNRRLAWVGIGAMAPILFAMAPPSRAKQRVARVLLALSPLALLYCAAGWTSNSRIFKPVEMVRSVVSSDADRSTGTRDIEDYNLIFTLKQGPLLGSGFGHEYIEMVHADDISRYFAQYRYVPHNSTLGLLAFGGTVVFTLQWLPLLAGALFAVRSVWRARQPLQRTAAVGALTAFVAYAVQGFGDMGLQSGEVATVCALALAVSSQLAVACGAFPVEVRLMGPIPRVRR